MILKSRKPDGALDRMHRLLRPKKSHTRNFRYWGKRILRIRATPHALALGIAIGVFSAFSPLLGVHLIFALAASFLLGGNPVAAGLATTLANPVTFPLMIAGNYELGHLLIGREGDAAVHVGDLIHLLGTFQLDAIWGPVLKPLLLGSFILGGIFAVATYFMVYYFARAVELARAERKHHRETMLP